MEQTLIIGQVTERIKGFLLNNYLFGYGVDELGDETSFLDMGILDSTGIIELITFIEREFNIEVLDHEILPENFDSIAYVSKYVHSKLSTVSDVAVGR